MDLIEQTTSNVINKIKILPASVASQIAAGEVIERPASIVKELLENSLDAGSNNIVVTIKNAGNSLIRITDNGCGIAKDDLPYAICQHATSKLQELCDLDCITSLGFRGEALASICAVAKCKITSAPIGASQAWSLEVNCNGEPENYKIMPSAHPIGTTIEVRDLFYSLPVRKRFLKSDKTEYQQVLEMFQKIALSNFSCAFTLISEEKIIYKLLKAEITAAKINRVKKIFGASFVQNATYFAGQAQGLSIHGWLGDKNMHRSQADQQYFFLNNRVIRDKLVLHAIKVAYNDIIPQGRHPCYILYLTIDPVEIDINVHPTKHEVRFCNSRWVHQFIVQQLNKVLAPPSMLALRDDFVDFNNKLVTENCETPGSNDAIDSKKESEIDESKDGMTLKSEPISRFNQRYTAVRWQGMSRNPISTSKQVDRHESPGSYIEVIDNLGEIVANFANYLLITKNIATKQYYLLDLKLAYSYLCYQQLEQQLQNNNIISNKLAVFSRVSLDSLFDQPLSLAKISRVLKAMQSFGFDYSMEYVECDNKLDLIYDTGEIVNDIIITAVPLACRYACPVQIFGICSRFLFSHDQLELELLPNRSPDGPDVLGDRYNLLLTELAACSLGRLADNLLLVEQQAIINNLAKIGYNNLAFMGRKIIKNLSCQDLKNLLA